MLEPFLHFLLGRIATVLDEEIRFLRGVKQKITTARTELSLTLGFVADADHLVSRGNNEVRACVALIREAALDLEELLAYLSDKAEMHRRRHRLALWRRRRPPGIAALSTLRYAGLKLQSILEQLSVCRVQLEASGVREQPQDRELGQGPRGLSLNSLQRDRRKTFPHHLGEEVVTEPLHRGIELLVGEMTKSGKDCCQFFSICGMGGVGKSTLARLIYQEQSVRDHFSHFAWVQIGPQFKQEDVWNDIFISLRLTNYEMGDSIAETLSTFLRKNKCLVVLDDVWGTSTWDCLRHAFPIPGGESEPNQTKILITTRNNQVGSTFGTRSFVYEPQCLNLDESWNFFTVKAYFEQITANPQEMEDMRRLGEEMVKFCAGLPLAIEVLAGVLRSKRTVQGWKGTLRNVKEYIRRGEISSEAEREQYSGVLWLLSLSYEELSYQVKQCFLHLAHFANDDISTKELHQLWMAEGLVLSEDEASAYFEKLVDRYLVQVAEKSLTGGVKKYQIHDLIRDLCLTKASEENFLQIKDFQTIHRSGTKEAAVSRKVRRLAVYIDDDTKEELIPLISETHDWVRSFVCFNSATNPNLAPVLKPLLQRFRRLRVLKFENQTRGEIGKLPKEIGELISLRFLSLKNSNVSKLPSSIRNLVHLQTLDLRTNCKMVISSMKILCLAKLRHLYLPQIVEVRSEVLHLRKLVNLRTLVNVPAKCCNMAALALLPNLEKLKVCDWRRDVTWIAQFRTLATLAVNNDSAYHERVDTAQLISSCLGIVKLHLEAKMKILPQSLHSCSYLEKLTLRKNHLEIDPMETLQNLPRLKILRFDENAFVGRRMVCSSTGFRMLECLYFNNLQHFAELGLVTGAFHRLRQMIILNCPSFSSTAREEIQRCVPGNFEFY